MDRYSKEIQKQKHLETWNSDSKEKGILNTIYFAGLEEEFANASQRKKKILYFIIYLSICLFSRDSFTLALAGLKLTLKIW